MRKLFLEALEPRWCMAGTIRMDWVRIDRPVELAETQQETATVAAGESDYIWQLSRVGKTQPIQLTVSAQPSETSAALDPAPHGGQQPQPASLSYTRYDATAYALAYTHVAAGSATISVETSASATEAAMTSSNIGSGSGWQLGASFSVVISGSGEASFLLYAAAFSSARRVVYGGGQQPEVDYFREGVWGWVSEVRVSGQAYTLTLTGDVGQTRILQSRFWAAYRSWASVRSLQETAELSFTVSADSYTAYPWLYSYTVQQYTAGGVNDWRHNSALVDRALASGSGQLAYQAAAQHLSMRGEVDGVWADQYVWNAHSSVAATDAVFSAGSLRANARHQTGSRSAVQPIDADSAATVELEWFSGLPSDRQARGRLSWAIWWLADTKLFV